MLKKKGSKKAPIEQFFYKSFLRFHFDNPDLVLFQISKTFMKKLFDGAFFEPFFKNFFFKMAKSVFVTSYRLNQSDTSKK